MSTGWAPPAVPLIAAHLGPDTGDAEREDLQPIRLHR
jgi:hypothetical protein